MTRDVLLESSTNTQKAGQSRLRSDLISLEKNHVRRLSVAKQVRTIIIIQKRTLFLLLEKYSAFCFFVNLLCLIHSLCDWTWIAVHSSRKIKMFIDTLKVYIRHWLTCNTYFSASRPNLGPFDVFFVIETSMQWDTEQYFVHAACYAVTYLFLLKIPLKTCMKYVLIKCILHGPCVYTYICIWLRKFEFPRRLSDLPGNCVVPFCC